MKYLAYGSNVNKDNMKHRCPESNFVDIVEINGYKLSFNGTGYLTIEKDLNNIMSVVLYEVSEQDIKRLDIYEGYPNLYHKKIIKYVKDKKEYEALIYIMNCFPKCLPKLDYLDYVLESYDKMNLNKKDLINAINESIENDESRKNIVKKEIIKNKIKMR